MTAMEIIDIMTVDARKKGMKYGEYAEKYGHLYPKPERAVDDGKKECALCGLLFKPGGESSKYCPACVDEAVRITNKKAYEAKKRRMAEGPKREAKYDKTCDICGKKFRAAGMMAKHCPDCAKAVQREQMRLARKRSRTKKQGTLPEGDEE